LLTAVVGGLITGAVNARARAGEDLESRRARSVLSALRLRIRHSRQRFRAERRKRQAVDLLSPKDRRRST